MNADIALPQGYSLNEYRIESTLGVGGFGLTYLATDSNLNLKVAIKEYLPADLVLRSEDQSVRSKSPVTAETFQWGRNRFLEESRTLASFRHPNIVRVMRFFEANQTAYMVMEFVAGEPLNDWVKPRRPLAEQAVLAIAHPLLDGLDVVHRAGYLHRDIKPQNIYVRRDGSPVLIDFGSARAAVADSELTSIVSPGFAPFEQYHTRGGQGPWSDLYALGGVLYWMVTGERPVEAPARAFKDPMVPAEEAADASRYRSQLLKAIDWALSPAKEARPQSIGDLRSALQRPAQEPVSGLVTILPQQAGPAFEPGAAARAPDAEIDAGTVGRIAAALAVHIGPISTKVVQSAAKKCGSVAELVEKVSAEIADGKLRAEFVKKHVPEEKSPSVSRPTGSAPFLSQPGPQASAPQRFEPAILARMEAELGQYIGAVARVVVRRAAAKARDESALYTLLAEQIEDAGERKAFMRKAMSISGKP